MELHFFFKELWYHICKTFKINLYTLLKASGLKKTPWLRRLILKLYPLFKTQEPENRTHFSDTYPSWLTKRKARSGQYIMSSLPVLSAMSIIYREENF